MKKCLFAVSFVLILVLHAETLELAPEQDAYTAAGWAAVSESISMNITIPPHIEPD